MLSPRLNKYSMQIRTDLAMELRELNPDIEGVSEQVENDGEIEIKRITITSDSAASALGKQRGSYITLDAPQLVARPLDLFEKMGECLGKELKKLIEKDPSECTILVVGLGNRGVTPDSLGPQVASRIYVTRHIKKFMPDALDFPTAGVCAIAPGVLGITGVETADIVKGVVEKTSPDVIIAIDSLASRRAARISTTVQLSDTGISPGSGVGNLRSELSKNSLGIPVIAIGVPLVVYASTISQDTIGMIADETGLHNDEEKLKSLAEKVSNERLGSMIVTPKDIDCIVDDMAGIIANGINIAIFGDTLETIRNLIA